MTVALAAATAGLAGIPVHLVTVNDYLAERDSQWMGLLYEFLGLTVDVIYHDIDPSDRQKAYAADITYGTNTEFGAWLDNLSMIMMYLMKS